MWLSEEDLNPFYQNFAINVMLRSPLDNFQGWLFRRARFTPASQVFLEALSDIAGYSEDQKSAFKDSMYQKADLKGLVKLSQVFPAVSQWFTLEANLKLSSE